MATKATVEAFKATLGENYDILLGKFEEGKFEALLDEQNFEKSVLGRATLKVKLEAEGFFKKAPKPQTIFSGLPPLAEKVGSSSDPSENKEHKKANLLVRPFKPLSSLPTSTSVASRIWTELEEGMTELGWGQESDIQGYVKQVLKDVIAAAGLGSKVTCYNELSVVRERPDIWIVCRKPYGIPIGVVEIKKPDFKEADSIMESTLLHGQVYDYMWRLRYFSGQKWVFGITTTYAQWRVCWLEDSDKMAKETVLPAQPEDVIVDVEPLVTIPDFEGEAIDLSKSFAESPAKRLIYGSDVYSFNSPQLIPTLISVILKMFHSPHDPVPLVDLKRSYISVTETSWFWIGSLPKEFTLKFSKMPTAAAKSLILLRDLRGGAHGRVWLACSTTGLVCVIKFPKRKVEELARELEIWTSVWKLPATLQRWNKEMALRMPFVCPCPEASRADPEVKSAVTAAVKLLAKHNWRHNDLSWRHVGLYKKDSKLTAVLFDLGDVEQVEDSSIAIEHMLNRLHLC